MVIRVMMRRPITLWALLMLMAQQQPQQAAAIRQLTAATTKSLLGCIRSSGAYTVDGSDPTYDEARSVGPSALAVICVGGMFTLLLPAPWPCNR